eukprot:gb/GEZN01008728.1/.p1 GENE.gb/GEZN01008728.1/~~gb/GEZN01008728.1/.p1  ORF type:complete len:402 (-),score=57.87 gb/GEZN01008728.1/:192-1331(-)
MWWVAASPSSDLEEAADMVLCEPGFLPVILSAGHGGWLDVPGAQVRSVGVNSPWGTDDNTFQLTQSISDAFYNATGMRPSMVRSTALRSYVDFNRPKPEATGFGLPAATAMFHKWHQCLSSMNSRITETCGRGLYLDIHGQSQRQKLLNVGLGVDAPQLNFPPEQFEFFRGISNVRAAAERAKQKQNMSFYEFVVGNASFGGLLENKGYSAIPSNVHNNNKENMFFYGGVGVASTLVRYYGSFNGGAIDSIQLEHPYAIRVDEQSRITYAQDLVEIAIEFFKSYYDFDMSLGDKCKDNGELWAETLRLPFDSADLSYELYYASKQAKAKRIGKEDGKEGRKEGEKEDGKEGKKEGGLSKEGKKEGGLSTEGRTRGRRRA